MSLNFSQVIGAIEAEIGLIYLPGAIRWCDEQTNGAWSNAIDRFDKALSVAIERKDSLLAQSEGKFYKATIIDLISKYKAFKNLSDAETFLQSIKPISGGKHERV